jgi:toxin ParE1/3/4
MNIVWSPEAIQDLISLRAYIAEESPAGARRTVLRILHGVEYLLADNPHMGRPGRVPDTRELVVPQTRHIAPYRVQGQALQILRVYHGARRWPESL